MTSFSDFFKAQHYSRATKRSHKPCPQHGRVRRVCEECTRVYCPKCPTHACYADEPVRTRAYRPNAALKPIWDLVKPLGAIGIEVHDDAHAFKILFPPNAMNTPSAGELADKLWARADLSALAITTAFRAGRGNNPPHWWVSFELKTAG